MNIQKLSAIMLIIYVSMQSAPVSALEKEDFIAKVCQAFSNSDINKLNQLLEANKWCKINMELDRGYTLLHYAVQISRSVNILNTLLKKGADVNFRTRFSNQTILHLVCLCEDDDVIVNMATRLLEEGLDVNATDNKGFTALHLAARRGNHDLVKLLLKYGADKNIKSNNEETACSVAKRMKGNIDSYFGRRDSYGKALIMRSNLEANFCVIAKGAEEVMRELSSSAE